MKNRVELLSPAGNMDGLFGNINAGCDAIYLSGKKYGARAYADNFSDEELLEAIKIAHVFEKKVYLTVNTLVKDSEIDELTEYIEPLVENGLDGVIVQDLGVIKRINDCFPDFPIHLSTQLSITGIEAINLLRNKYNITRVVPARELSLEEIKDIKQYTGIEIETFVHGALCYSYSGRCLFSSLIGGRSGNRGRCAQPCRLPYKNRDGKDSYPFSMKDLCSVNIIPELIESGIDSFKIEGRMKKPVYSAGVTAIYRKYIDRYYSNGSIAVSKQDMNILKQLYLRSDVSEGYYHKYNGKDMVSVNSPSYNGTNDEVLSMITEKYLRNKPKRAINVRCKFVKGENFELELYDDKYSAKISSVEVLAATSSPINRERLETQISKMGDTFYSVDKIDIDMTEDGFLPIKQINEIRRECVSYLTEQILNGK